jgi:WD40 repeat protein
LAVGYEDGLVLLIDPDNASIIKTHRSHKYGLSHFKYLNGDRSGLLAVAVPSLDFAKDYGIRVWDLDRNKFCRVFKGHETPIQSITCHSTRDMCLSTSSDGVSNIWDVREEKPIWSNQGSTNISSFDLTFNSSMFALSNATTKSIQIYDLRFPENPAYEFTRLACGADELILSTSADSGGKVYIGSHSNGTLTTLDISKGKQESMILLSPIRGGGGKRKFHLSLSTCKNFVSITNMSNHVEIWNLEARVKVKTLMGHGGPPIAAFSPSHTLIATVSMPVALWVPCSGGLDIS